MTIDYQDRKAICSEILSQMKEAKTLSKKRPIDKVCMTSYHKGVYTGLAVAMDLVQLYEELKNPESKGK